MKRKALLVLYSYHHGNTEAIADAFARVLDADVKSPRHIDPGEIQEYGLVGFGSGIYGGKHHQTILDLADRLPQSAEGMAFVFSTCGVPVIGLTEEVVEENHSALREKLKSKGYVIVDEFSCAGLNTNNFLKLFGGINKGRPSAEDLEHAEAFARKLRQSVLDSPVCRESAEEGKRSHQ